MKYIQENGFIYCVEQIGKAEIKSGIGNDKRLELISENNAEKIYQWQKFDIEKGRIVVIKELSESEVKIKELEDTLNTLGKQLVKEKIEGIKKDKTISELGKHETKLSMDLMRMKNEVNALKQSFEKDKKGGE